jgi:Zn-finger protein
MTYLEWFDAHAQRHGAVMEKLRSRGMDKTAIIVYFDFENMVEAEPDFCPLYAEKKKCHDMEKLNCYLCACPNFRFNDKGIDVKEGNTVFSTCAIASKDGKAALFGSAIHQDCSQCTVPHHRDYVEKVFDTVWERIMAKCRTM